MRAAEAVPALALVHKKPKAGVKSENNFHINVKEGEQDGPMVRFSTKRGVSQ